MKKTTAAARAAMLTTMLGIGISSGAMSMAQAQNQPPAQKQARPTAAALPNGATAINETYQDWLVMCNAGETGRQCLLAQQQRQTETNQLVLAVEYFEIGKDALRGNLVLPFGLALADGVTLQVDDGPVSAPLPFSTCLPAGCLVTLDLDAALVGALRSGEALNLAAKAQDSGQGIQLRISLSGFATAQDRALALKEG